MGGRKNVTIINHTNGEKLKIEQEIKNHSVFLLLSNTQ